MPAPAPVTYATPALAPMTYAALAAAPVTMEAPIYAAPEAAQPRPTYSAPMAQPMPTYNAPIAAPAPTITVAPAQYCTAPAPAMTMPAGGSVASWRQCFSSSLHGLVDFSGCYDIYCSTSSVYDASSCSSCTLPLHLPLR
eukprot:TRINITY_DN1070_c0_g1_i14.p1 TRINITY_DN1070_c0_g1~~TRINITY_DN1070_c0_g1_i14.p1  ORF type:complete len:140 (+),score=25.87 TRINITY_DN1070_c0_g1_i14:245-664(+)